MNIENDGLESLFVALKALNPKWEKIVNNNGKVHLYLYSEHKYSDNTFYYVQIGVAHIKDRNSYSSHSTTPIFHLSSNAYGIDIQRSRLWFSDKNTAEKLALTYNKRAQEALEAINRRESLKKEESDHLNCLRAKIKKLFVGLEYECSAYKNKVTIKVEKISEYSWAWTLCTYDGDNYQIEESPGIKLEIVLKLIAEIGATTVGYWKFKPYYGREDLYTINETAEIPAAKILEFITLTPQYNE